MSVEKYIKQEIEKQVKDKQASNCLITCCATILIYSYFLLHTSLGALMYGNDISIYQNQIIQQNLKINILEQFIIDKNINPLIVKASQFKLDQKQHFKNLIYARTVLENIKCQNLPIYLQVLQRLSIYHQHNSQFSQFININQKLLKIYQAKNCSQHSQKCIEISNRIGSGYFNKKQFDDALKYFQFCLRLLTNKENKQKQKQKIYTLQNGKLFWKLAYCYQKNDQLQKSWDHYNKGLSELVKVRKRLSENYESQNIPIVDKFIDNCKIRLNEIQAKLKKTQL